MNPEFLQTPDILLFIVVTWSLVWKGLGLFRAARLNQKQWFIAMLIVNLFGILEIIYLFGFAKEKMKLEELYFWKYFPKPQKKS